MKDWKTEKIETRRWLHQRFPSAFMGAGSQKPPLKVGIRDDVLAAIEGFEDAPRPAGIGRAIADYASGPSYLLNCRAGTHRVALDGSSAGVVTEQDERFAFTRARRILARMKGAPRQTEAFKRLLARMEAEIAAHDERCLVPA